MRKEKYQDLEYEHEGNAVVHVSVIRKDNIEGSSWNCMIYFHSSSHIKLISSASFVAELIDCFRKHVAQIAGSSSILLSSFLSQ